MPIQVLKKEISELIAAGEVVERPASVVKELLENAMDAGAKKIEVELRRNGLAYIRVTDDGCGIPRGEIKTAFLRHATSKIGTAADLDNIATLGFRGEALAAIAAVSRVRLVTKTKTEEFALEYRIEGGREQSLEAAAGDDGTTIIVEDLFFNTPARMKFLKKDVSEGSAVQSVVQQLSLSHPDISFRLIREGKAVVSTPGNGDLYAAIYAVLPREVAEGMIEVGEESVPISVFGYAGKPESSRKSRGFQYVFINGRYVKSTTVTAAVEQAYRNLNMAGRFPSFVLNLSMPYEDVDVNVHPAKTEVRFKNDREVFSTVHRVVVDALGRFAGNFARQKEEIGIDHGIKEESPADGAPADRMKLDPGEKQEAQGSPDRFAPFLTYAPQEDKLKLNASLRQSSADFSGDGIDASTPRAGIPEAPHIKRKNLDIDPAPKEMGISPQIEAQQIRVIGEIFETYIVVEHGEDLLLIDKHAAHERILFEQFRRTDLHSERQLLLQPEIIAVSPSEKDALLSAERQLLLVGFLVEDFGINEVAVREVPIYFPGKDVESAVLELAGQLMRFSDQLETEETSWLLHSISCRAAIKAGHKTSEREMVALAKEIVEGTVPKYCPHGRPVYMRMTKKEIEKQFGRIQ